MHATLCRLLSRASNTLYFQQNSHLLSRSLQIDAEKHPKWLLEEATKAYTLDKMHPVVQDFLKACDRCWQIETQIQEDNPTLSLEQVQKRALAQLEKEQEEAFGDG